MQQTPLENPVFVTRAEHDQLKQEVEEGFAKIDATITHLTEAMILGDDKIYVEMGRRFDQMNGRFDKVDGRFDTVESRLGRLEGDVGTLKSDMQLIKNHFGIVG